jgi:hypothetical protein
MAKKSVTPTKTIKSAPGTLPARLSVERKGLYISEDQVKT